IRIRNLELTGGVNSLPDTFPAFAYYKGSHNLLTGLFRSEKALATPEGAAFLQSDDSINEVEEYYNRSFRENGWSVIQSHRSETEILLMAESPFGKLITVILRAGPKTDIKVYVKRLGGD
ncbi:MAG: hypothetical protein OEZ34_04385, partial [Spirochaetia bacterium]|nr:hypothetical protein [Spirochaetia bacterium]